MLFKEQRSRARGANVATMTSVQPFQLGNKQSSSRVLSLLFLCFGVFVGAGAGTEHKLVFPLVYCLGWHQTYRNTPDVANPTQRLGRVQPQPGTSQSNLAALDCWQVTGSRTPSTLRLSLVVSTNSNAIHAKALPYNKNPKDSKVQLESQKGAIAYK